MQQLLPYLKFTLVQKINSVGDYEKTNFYELWQQQKQLKTMEMHEAWPDIYNEQGFIQALLLTSIFHEG